MPPFDNKGKRLVLVSGHREMREQEQEERSKAERPKRRTSRIVPTTVRNRATRNSHSRIGFLSVAPTVT